MGFNGYVGWGRWPSMSKGKDEATAKLDLFGG